MWARIMDDTELSAAAAPTWALGNTFQNRNVSSPAPQNANV